MDNRNYGFNDSDDNKKAKKQKPSDSWPFFIAWPIKLVKLVFTIIVGFFQYIGKFFSWLWNKVTGSRSRKKRKKDRNSKNKEKIKKILFWGATTVFVFGFLATTIIVAWASSNLPSPDKLTQRQVAQSTKIYDRTGEHLLYEIFAGKNRTLLDLEDIPDDLKNAVIATEDDKFYQHYGVRPLSIARAVFNAVFKGERIQGTSTLTQQLVKNAILSRERSYIRKIKEAILAVRLEQKYSKDQILQIYFNEIPYGSTNYGIEAAAQSYYGKHASELTLKESATLAGLPKAPTTYLNNPKELKQRRNFVLYRMQQEGYINEQEMNKVQAKPVTLSQDISDIKAPHFVMHVKQKLVDKFGRKKVESGGLKVITTLDWDKQKLAKKIVDKKGKQVLKEAKANNMAMLALDPKTSQVLTMIGSKDFNDNKINGKFNVVTQGKRQPGSSFKPIVYTAAFEKGYTPSTILYDVLTDFAPSEGREYKPKNYDLKERGPVTMRKALQGSMNIPAVKTLYLTGEDQAREFAERLGYSTLSEGNFGLSLVLGGGEVRMIEHINAFATLANGGVKRSPTSILKVEEPDGNILLENKKQEGKRVIESKFTKTITDVLSDNQARAFAFGQNSVLNLKDRPVAAKTGTTNNYVDAWTVGYTPNLVTGVWGGNTDNSPMKRGFGGSKVAGPIWNEFMKQALKEKEVKTFPEPPEIKTDKPVLQGSGGKITLKVNKETGKLSSSSTPEHLIEERTYVPPHSILHYVQKDNPQGPPPKNPENDPQYNVWEQAIGDWIKKMEEKEDTNFTFEEPPTDKDTEYSEELKPELTVVFPEEKEELNSRQIDTDIRATAPRGVEKVIYKIDDRYVGVEEKHPFNLNYYARDLVNGWHTLTVIAEDDIGNRTQKEVKFLLKAEKEPPTVTWINKRNKLSKQSLPFTFLVKPFKEDQIQEIKIQAQKDDKEIEIASITDFSNKINEGLSFSLKKLEAGDWALTPIINTKGNKTLKGEVLELKITD